MAKKLAIGCGVVAVLGVIAVVALIILAPRMFEWAQEQIAVQIAEEEKRQQLAENWQPPAKSAGPETLFPAKVGDARLTSQDERAEIPDFRFDVKGRHAVYRVGSDDVDVFVYQVTALEKEALFRRVEDAYKRSEGGGGLRRITKMGYRCYYESPEHHQNHFWYLKGWLFVFRTHAAEDQEPFVMAYLKAVSAEQPAGVQPK